MLQQTEQAEFLESQEVTASGSRIMVVEDESIVAMDLQGRLEVLGHEVPAVCDTGEEAVEMAGKVRPDLVLMDIMLKGEMRGTEAAAAIRSRYAIPVIYLTAYSDPATLGRAKMAEPYGYLLKPFDEAELRTTIVMALHKSQMDRRLRDQRNWLNAVLSSISDALITTDRQRRVTYMNPSAECYTGWLLEDAKGLPLDEVFVLLDEETGQAVDSAVSSPLSSRCRRAVVTSRFDQRVPVTHNASPMNDDDGNTEGYVVTFQRRNGAIEN